MKLTAISFSAGSASPPVDSRVELLFEPDWFERIWGQRKAVRTFVQPWPPSTVWWELGNAKRASPSEDAACVEATELARQLQTSSWSKPT